MNKRNKKLSQEELGNLGPAKAGFSPSSCSQPVYLRLKNKESGLEFIKHYWESFQTTLDDDAVIKIQFSSAPQLDFSLPNESHSCFQDYKAAIIGKSQSLVD